MKCPRCGSEVEKGWKYCPSCGETLQNGGFFNIGRIFDRFQKMQEEISKSMEKDFEVFDLSPAFGKPLKKSARGFTIRITRAGNNEPKISVKTFGDVDKETVRDEMKGMAGDMGMQKSPEPKEEKPLPVPKYTEEPQAHVKHIESGVLVEIDVPGVKSEKDVRVTELESSVEVRAIAGDKAYFKILTKPEDYRITRKELEKGKLVIEFS